MEGEHVSVENTLKERGARYGDFELQAYYAQVLKAWVRNAPSYEGCTFEMKESLDNILSKISRILTGDPKYPDNWHDIQGYAKLVEDGLTKENG